MKQNTLLGGSLLWLGAAISIAEILTGALIAPLGFGTGLIAILAGHLIGGILLYFVGLMGAKSRKGAMESTSLSFGKYGSIFFSVLNILQLVGWTAVMIISSAKALGAAVGFSGDWVWCIVIGALIVLWVLAWLRNSGILNHIAVGALLVLCIILGIIVFKTGTYTPLSETMSFGLALELSIAMPISWLPLISDYTKHADKPVKFTLVSSLSYFAGSSFMYLIGLGAALFAGTSDIVQILSVSGLGVAAMVIVVLSTVTTTFLDVFSAGESIALIYHKVNKKLAGVLICVVGTIIAIFTPIEEYQNFLYLIGSVFVPMAAIMTADYFINKNTDFKGKLNMINAVLWVIGFIIYRVFLNIDTVFGSTIPVVIIIMLICVITNAVRKAVIKNVS